MVPLAEMIFCFVVFFYFLKLLPFTLLEELEMQVLLALKALAKSTPAQLFRVELGNPWLFWLLSEYKSHSRRCRILLRMLGLVVQQELPSRRLLQSG